MAPPRFVNLDGSGPPLFERIIKWAITDNLAGRRRRSPRRAEIPTVRTDPDALATPPRTGEPARLTWLGHSSWLAQLDGVSLLIDPVLSDTIPVFTRRNVPPALRAPQLPRIDASLVSHNHYDHLDMPTHRQVRARAIAGKGMGALFAAEGIRCDELGWWDAVEVGPVKVTFVPAQHWSRRSLFDTNATLWGGFVIEGSTARLYHTGDTAYFDGFAEIGRRFPGIDAAMIPIGAYDPGWFMEHQHMNPEQAVQSFVDLGARAVLAMHWGTFKLTDEPLDEPPLRLAAEWKRRGLAEPTCHVLAVGQTLQAGRGAPP